MKNYDYLSYDQYNDATQWSIFYSEFTHETSGFGDRARVSLVQTISEKQLFVKANYMYSMTLDDQGTLSQNWAF